MNKPFKILLVIILSVIIWNLPVPENLQPKAWLMFAIFSGMIFSVIINALPMGVATLLAITTTLLLNVLSYDEIFKAFATPLIWLVVGAFFVAQGFIESGLGKRIAYIFIVAFHRSLLGIGYGIAMAEVLLAISIPSVTARSGGIVYPAILSLIDVIGDKNAKQDSNSVNTYLILVAYQLTVVTSSMFLTAMAGNFVLVKLAEKVNVFIDWQTWAMAAILPGIISLAVIPFLLYKYIKPTINRKQQQQKNILALLQNLGPMQFKEKIMLIIFFLLLFLWLFGADFGISAALSVLIAVCAMLIFQVIQWEDVVKNHAAWDTFFWFGGLVAIASGLKDLGFTPWLSHFVADLFGGFPPFAVVAILLLIYFYSHYLFASSTAHIGAMFLPFLLVTMNFHFSNTILVLLFAFASNLYGGLTHYGLGPAPIIFSGGFVKLSTWWKVGFFISVVNIVIWLTTGVFWWKYLQLY